MSFYIILLIINMAQKEINIPEELYVKIQKRVEESKEFDSVDEYVKYVLEQVVEKIEEKKEEKAYSKEDEEKVKERLRSLGYLD